MTNSQYDYQLDARFECSTVAMPPHVCQVGGNFHCLACKDRAVL